MADTRTKAQRQRQMYQEREREHLRNMGLIQYAVECIDKMKEAVDPFELSKWDKVTDKYITLSKRYLPELKAVEISGSIDTNTDADQLPDSVLAHIAAASSAGAVEASGGEEESTSVH